MYDDECSLVTIKDWHIIILHTKSLRSIINWHMRVPRTLARALMSYDIILVKIGRAVDSGQHLIQVGFV